MKIKKTIALVLLICIFSALLTACSRGNIIHSGCRIIEDDGEHIIYQIVCDECGYEVGDPSSTLFDDPKIYYVMSCPRCDALIKLIIERE